jgi:hypothetical protein
MSHQDHFELLADKLSADLVITDFYNDKSPEWNEFLTSTGKFSSFSGLITTGVPITNKVHSIYDNEATDLVMLSDLYRLYKMDKLLNYYDNVLYIDYDSYFKSFDNLVVEINNHINKNDGRVLMYRCYDLVESDKLKYYYNNNNGFMLTSQSLLPYFKDYLEYLVRKNISKDSRSLYGPNFISYIWNRTNLITNTSNNMILATSPTIFDKGSILNNEFINNPTNECLSMSFMNKDLWSKLQ